MPKKRSSIKHAQSTLQFEQHYERRARDSAFESEILVEIRGQEVFIRKDGYPELLCVAEEPKQFWRTVWRAMCEQFPVLSRYVH